MPNSLNPLSERCTENPEIKKEKISFEYKNKNWYQISGVNIYGFVDYEFNTTLNYLNNLLPENEQKAITIFNLSNNYSTIMFMQKILCDINRLVLIERKNNKNQI